MRWPTHMTNKLGLSLVLCIILLSALIIFSTYYGPSITTTDNFFYVDYGYSTIKTGINVLPLSNALANEYVLIFGIGIMDLIFGFNVFSASFFNFILLAFTIFFVYYIGKYLFGVLGGVISAFFCALSPLLLIETAQVGDVTSATFFVSLSMLLYVLYLSKEKHQLAYLAFSGFTAALGIIALYEVLLIIPALFVLILLNLSSGKFRLNRLIHSFIVFAIGLLLGLAATMLISFTISGSLFTLFGLGASYLSYINSIPLPYNSFFSYGLWLIGLNGKIFLGSLIPSPNIYMLTFTLSAIFFAILLRKKALVPAVWLVSILTLLPLISKTAYITPLERYLAIVVPAQALIIGGGIAKSITFKNKIHHLTSVSHVRGLLIFTSVLLSIILISTSVIAVIQEGSINNAVYNAIKTAINVVANKNATLYSTSVNLATALLVYSNFTINNLNIVNNLSCTNVSNTITQGSYLLLPQSYNFTCGSTEIIYMPNESGMLGKYESIYGRSLTDMIPYVLKVVK